ncbi:unnamed protein product, partial [Chrysoparadoxa australica]
RRIVVTALPTACSRHNCPARPHALAAAVRANKGKGAVSILLVIEDEKYAFAAGAAVARGFSLYNLKAEQPVEVDVNVYFTAAPTAVPEECSVVARGIQLTARLVDTPPNILHTTQFAAEARAVAEGLIAEGKAVTVKVISGEELNDQGFGGIYGVGKAAVEPPALVILSYSSADAAASDPSVCWVGKGIVYDTGGLSIKTKTGMPGMKRDMGGAAGILGAFQAAISGGFTGTLHALLCMAENSVASNATRPDDIHTLYSGKTVEINNTDAEGRLVLGDGVAYAVKHLNPGVLVDMATLTGAQGVATGQKHGAIYCNDETLEQKAVLAGKLSGDLTHPVPYGPELYASEFKSAVADMKNSVACRSNAQVSCAAQFIGNHLGDYQTHGAWLHIDMASSSYVGERATGYGVALLFTLLKTYSAKKNV